MVQPVSVDHAKVNNEEYHFGDYADMLLTLDAAGRNAAETVWLNRQRYPSSSVPNWQTFLADDHRVRETGTVQFLMREGDHRTTTLTIGRTRYYK